MITRREILIVITACALAAPLGSFAQQQDKVWRVGILNIGALNDPHSKSHLDMQKALQDLGYVDGRDISFEVLYADYKVERLPTLAADLVSHKVDLIFGAGSASAMAAKQATKTIPIVFAGAAAPVEVGLVSNLAHPGGNVTGTANIGLELSAKRVQLLREAFPKISRLAVFATEEAQVAAQLTEVRRATASLKMEVTTIQVQRHDDFGPALARLRSWRADSLYGLTAGINRTNRQLLGDFAAEIRLPAIFPDVEYVEAGCLMSYGPNQRAIYRRSATYIDRIFKGAKPADLPVELPTTFDLAVNMKTAKAMGIKIPNSILLRADKVIE